MAKLRKFTAYRRRENRPYTRKSKYRSKSFIRATPNCKIIRYDMGARKHYFPFEVKLHVDSRIQIRHNALESARLAANRFLEKNLGRQGFHLKLRAYPHHYLRENPLASGAGADRMSTGMKCAFGKVVGMAAQFVEGQVLFSCYVKKKHENVVRKAFLRASQKLPCKCTITVNESSPEAQGFDSDIISRQEKEEEDSTPQVEESEESEEVSQENTQDSEEKEEASKEDSDSSEKKE